MRIGRKEAILALIASVIPWVGRRANAQDRLKATPRLQQSPEIVELQRRIAALEAQLATQVGFTKDAYGNLKLRGNGSVTIESGTSTQINASGSISIKASTTAEVLSSATMTIRGAVVNVN